MKKTILATLLLSFGMTSSVMAAPQPPGGVTLQWTGSVPAIATPGAGYWIVKDGELDFSAGVLTFVNDTNGPALQSSSEIGFKVVKDATPDANPYDPGTDIEKVNYSYMLDNLKVGINGIPASQAANGYFAVHANGADTPLALNTASTLSDEPTRLTIKSNAGATTPVALIPGADVVVQSIITITPDF
ncbi:hypothetical protein [Shewanella colwelliana]|uniref:hypothetical protein n=1 Tax=Shewanella colwelliana TaxID=23 RepID=UPI003735EC43